jgi:hypothetical protein
VRWIIVISLRADRIWGPINLLCSGYWRLFPFWLKRQGREADHSSKTNAEVKKEWNCISTPQYAFMTYCSVTYAQRQFYLLPE